MSAKSKMLKSSLYSVYSSMLFKNHYHCAICCQTRCFYCFWPFVLFLFVCFFLSFYLPLISMDCSNNTGFNRPQFHFFQKSVPGFHQNTATAPPSNAILFWSQKSLNDVAICWMELNSAKDETNWKYLQLWYTGEGKERTGTQDPGI